jgi:3-deoxy-7-phosphoheptulonate synthase
MEAIVSSKEELIGCAVPVKPKVNAKREPVIVKVRDVEFGGEQIIVIAGPCAVENIAQLTETAFSVKESNAKILRGGAFKPRSSPYSFQGLGEQGLKMLRDISIQTGLPVVTEVIDIRQIDLVSKYADMLQIGSRNMQNYPLLKEIGMTRKPVLLKRGMMATVEEFLLAAEYILSQGNNQVVLCERGIRTFETSTRNTLDISAVPVLKQRSPLPVIVDPSHGTGIRDLVPSLAKAAVAAGADGLIMEVHYKPEEALCDGQQSLNLNEFSKLMYDLERIAKAIDRSI